MAVAWIVLGVLLVVLELHHLALYPAFAAVGAFAAATVAAVLPSALPAQFVVAAAVTGVGVVCARPFVARIVHERRERPTVPGVHGGLVGTQAVVADEVADGRRPGHVRLAGERWLAVSGDGRLLTTGTEVLVTAVTGTTLTVWPLDPAHDMHPPSPTEVP